MARLPELDPELDGALQRPNGWSWRVRGALAPLVEALERAERAPDGPEALDAKRSKLFALLETNGREVFVKRFQLPDVGARLRETLRLSGDRLGFKGARVEAAHTLVAERLGARVPRLLVYGERRRGGLVREQILAFEGLGRHTRLDRAVEDARDAGRRREVLQRGLELLCELWDLGLAHLDGNARNLLLAPEGAAGDRVCDLEQLVRMQAPRGEVAAFVLGYLFHLGLREHVPREEYDALALPALERVCGGEPSATVLKAYREFQKSHVKRRARLRLARGGLAAVPELARRVRGRSVPREYRGGGAQGARP